MKIYVNEAAREVGEYIADCKKLSLERLSKRELLELISEWEDLTFEQFTSDPWNEDEEILFPARRAIYDRIKEEENDTSNS